MMTIAGTLSPPRENGVNWGLKTVRKSLARDEGAHHLPFVTTTGIGEAIELIYAESGEVSAFWRARANLDSMDGITQGGILGVIADYLQAHTYLTLLDKPAGFSTVDLQTRFLRPVRSGQVYRVDTLVIEQSRRTTIIESFIRSKDEKLCTHITGSWQIVERDFAVQTAAE